MGTRVIGQYLISKKIFISADHGMAIIYCLQSDLVRPCWTRVLKLSSSPTMKPRIASRNASHVQVSPFEGLRLKQAHAYANKVRPRLQWLLGYLRHVGGSWRINTEAMDSHIWEVWVENSWKFRLGVWIPATLAILLLRTFAFARKFLV